MRIGKVRYPDDEISAPSKRAAVAAVALNAGPARFESGPPKDWIRQFEGPHNMHVAPRWLSEDLVLVEGRYFQRPVPRSASCHYDGQRTFPLTAGPVTFYFY